MKVLLVSQGQEIGGIEKLEYEYYNHLKNQFDFSFIVPNNNIFNNDNVYYFNLDLKKYRNRIKYYKNINKVLKNNNFDVVHINSSAFFFSFIVSYLAKKNKVKKVIAHSHNTIKLSIIKKIFRYILSPIYIRKVNKFLSCSNQAISSLLIDKYKDKVNVLYNGIDIENYKFNEKERDNLRKEYNLTNQKVYGNVGRISKQKNQEYLVDLFNEISKIEDNSVLVLVGDGEILDKVKSKVKELGLDNRVLFLGYRDDVNKILNMFDVFIFPSKYEGFGLSLVEAKINGLITISSDVVPKEVNNDCFNLNDDIKEVAKMIVNKDISNKRKDCYKNYLDYDIKNVCNQISKIYLEKE